jgi:hypothetical protein
MNFFGCIIREALQILLVYFAFCSGTLTDVHSCSQFKRVAGMDYAISVMAWLMRFIAVQPVSCFIPSGNNYLPLNTCITTFNLYII